MDDKKLAQDKCIDDVKEIPSEVQDLVKKTWRHEENSEIF